MEDLKKVVVVTRGRTGSTAITEELGRAPGCCGEQEAFSRSADAPFYALPPFDVWRRHRPVGDEARTADAYLDVLEHLARARQSRALFWKALSQHFDERPYLGDMLRRRGYHAIVLRRAPVRRVISGLVAQRSGLYNSYKPLRGGRRFTIDPDQLRRLAAYESFAAARDEALLFRLKLPTVEADYETYLADRAGFFERIYSGLGLPAALPPPSRYAVLLPDLRAALTNFDEVRAVGDEFGERL